MEWRNYNMAYYDRDKGIVLNEEDKEMFKQSAYNFQLKKSHHPVTDKIMKWVVGDLNIINLKEE